MTKSEIIAALSSTTLAGEKTKEILGRLIKDGFDTAKEINEQFQFLQLAYQFKIAQLDEMIQEWAFSELDEFFKKVKLIRYGRYKIYMAKSKNHKTF
jgi:hypothetical protein